MKLERTVRGIGGEPIDIIVAYGGMFSVRIASRGRTPPISISLTELEAVAVRDLLTAIFARE